MMIRRKPRLRSNISRAPRRDFPKHKQWVRGHACIVEGCENRRIQFAHVRSAANAGKGQKPGDWFGVPLCAPSIDGEGHHMEQHRIGQPAFERKYGLDLFKVALEFARRSPDQLMKEAAREAGVL